MSINQQRKSHTRLLIASSLFVASVFASFLISYLSHQGASYWVATHSIAKGVQVEATDVKLMKSELPPRVMGYFGSIDNPIGSITRRSIFAGELLHIGALSDDAENLTAESLSLAVRSSDLPVAIAPGDLVSLYQVHDARNGETVTEPNRVISGVFIEEISRSGTNFGSDIALTVTLHRDDVPKVLTATSSGRIVVVAHRG